MKTALLLAVGGLITTQVISQSVEKSKLNPKQFYSANESEKQEIYQASRGVSAAAAAGDTAWIEDFAGGIPSGWVLGGANSASCPWTHSYTGSHGYFNGGNYPAVAPGMNSASAANGFLLCDPDSANNAMYGQPSGTTYQYLESNITTSAIDLTLYPTVRLEFEQAFRYNNSPDLEVSVSTDGTTWTTFEAKGSIVANASSPDPMTFSMDVSSLVGGSSTAYVKIGWSARVYYWMIDDIRFTVPPANDLVIDGAFYRTQRDTGISQYYTRMPMSQAVLDTLQFSANVTNTGSATQPNTKFTNGVDGPTGMTTMTSNLVSLSAGNSDSLIISNSFIFNQGMGDYAFSYMVSSDSTDANPNDNVMDTVLVEVTDSTYSRDAGAVGNYWYGAGTSFEIGPLYDIYDTVKVTSVSLAVGANSEAGEVISVYIYDGSLTTPITSREFIVLDSATIGTLVSYSIPEVVLPPGQYIVTYKTYSDKVFFRRSSFSADPQTCFVDVDASGTFGYTTAMPVVRMNVSSELFVCDLEVTANQTDNNTGVAVASKGTMPYVYLWSNGDAGADLVNVSPGFYTVTVTDDSACTATASVDIISGVMENEIKGSISLYPNPNNGIFQLSLEGVNAGTYNVSVKNLIGQSIYENPINVGGNYNENMALSHLENGIYFLEISNDSGERSVVKFVVK